mmetsp:Transcript_80263/g.194566  ORF Transcript_80263/g.194566 Transcript_80263/m.194566 type:complete len:223 (+) Transcript_80263:155-823(+)
MRAPRPLRRQCGKCGMEGAEEFCLPLGAQGCRLGCASLVEGLVGADDGEQDRVAHRGAVQLVAAAAEATELRGRRAQHPCGVEDESLMVGTQRGVWLEGHAEAKRLALLELALGVGNRRSAHLPSHPLRDERRHVHAVFHLATRARNGATNLVTNVLNRRVPTASCVANHVKHPRCQRGCVACFCCPPRQMIPGVAKCYFWRLRCCIEQATLLVLALFHGVQ